MTTRNCTLNMNSARDLAARFLRHRHVGTGWNSTEDRDLARESTELMYASHAAHNRLG